MRAGSLGGCRRLNSAHENYYEPDRPNYVVRLLRRAKRDGIQCRVRGPYRARGPLPRRVESLVWETDITGLENIAKEIKLTEPWRRNPKRISEFQRFKEYLLRPRDLRGGIRAEVKKARKILAL